MAIKLLRGFENVDRGLILSQSGKALAIDTAHFPLSIARITVPVSLSTSYNFESSSYPLYFPGGTVQALDVSISDSANAPVSYRASGANHRNKYTGTTVFATSTWAYQNHTINWRTLIDDLHLRFSRSTQKIWWECRVQVQAYDVTWSQVRHTATVYGQKDCLNGFSVYGDYTVSYFTTDTPSGMSQTTGFTVSAS